MKFVSSKRIVDYAQRLGAAQDERAEIKARLKALDAEIEALEVFLLARKPDGFQFADPDGYLMQAQPTFGQRSIVDLDKVRRDYAKRGLEVPTKNPRWKHVDLFYVTE